MLERIPQRIDHYRYTDKGVILEGVITSEESEKELPRLNEAIVKSAGDIEYLLEFDRDKFSNRIVSGFVKTKVILQCQRCMSDFTLDLSCDIATAFVQNDFDIKSAEDSNYETFWLEQKEYLDPRILIEDELLLALPQIPMHSHMKNSDTASSSCQVQSAYPANENAADDMNIMSQDAAKVASDGKDSEQVDKNNPFAVLKQLKK